MIKSIKLNRQEFSEGNIGKPEYIKRMYSEWHSVLFEYAGSIADTNVKKIEIMDEEVIITTRDRGIRLSAVIQDRRIAPIAMLNFCDYEKDETKMTLNLVDDAATVLDVGANIGWYSLNLAATHRCAKIHAFEPIPMTFAVLNKNKDLNKFRNITINNFGLSNEPGEFPFYYYPEGSGNASLVNLSERVDINPVFCKLKTIDSYVYENDLIIDFIKCDVEGAELLVFQGGRNILERDHPIVFSEILRKWSAKFKYHPNEIFNLMYSLGYKAYSVEGGFLKEFHLMDEGTMQTNFFFLHAVKHQGKIQKYSLP